MRPFMDLHTPLAVRISVTPIIDVAMVLVITLLITAPMIARSDIEINLPQTQTKSVEDEVRVSVTLGTDGRVAVEDKIVPPAGLATALKERLAQAGDENVLVVVRADAAMPYREVREAMLKVRSAGAKRIAFATRLRGGEDQ
jgi:biopolymer transport protein TolR